MDERGANIDLLFRNGLRDYEVLPPEDVWKGIAPAVKQSKSVTFLKAAAVAAVIVSLGVIAYMLGRSAGSDIYYGNTEFSIAVSDPLRLPSLAANFTEPDFTGIESMVSISGNEAEADATLNETQDGIQEFKAPDQAGIGEIVIPDYRNTLPVSLYTGKDVISGTAPGEQDIPEAVIPGFFPEILPDRFTQRWSVSAMASPTYYSRIGSAHGLPGEVISSEQPVVSYSGGFTVAYKINKRFSIQTGLYYARHGNEIEGVNSFAGFDKYTETKGGHNFELLTSNGRVFTSNDDFFLADRQGERIQSQFTADVFDPQKASLRYIDNSIIQNFSYLQMPVMLRYKLIDKDLDFNVVGGVSYDLLIGNSAFVRSGGEKYALGITHGLNSYLFSSSLGMGMEYSFSRKVSLNLEPTLRYFLSPFSNEAIPGIHPYSFGVFSGFSYKF